MWKNRYRDYALDLDWSQEKVEPRAGIIGCEMHEINGWGENYEPEEKSKPFWGTLISKVRKNGKV